MNSSFLQLCCLTAAFVLSSCSASSEDSGQPHKPSQPAATPDVSGANGDISTPSAPVDAGGGLQFNVPGEQDSGTNPSSNDDCAESAKLIYLVSVQNDLYSFTPEIDARAAYKKIGRLTCSSTGEPQSMSVDRAGNAYVFYNGGEMFSVSTKDASCKPTSYKHPVVKTINQLGMGFTADAPGSRGQILYIISPDFGLATVNTSTFQVDKKNVLKSSAAELTGGPDAKLFSFTADTGALAEVNPSSYKETPIHAFSDLQNTVAWAFARYAGKFYIFTASEALLGGTRSSKTTVYDSVARQSTIRDQDLGFTVVGAGQSTCVPPPAPR